MWWAAYWMSRVALWLRRPLNLVLILFAAHLVLLNLWTFWTYKGTQYRVWEQGLLGLNVLASIVIFLLVPRHMLVARIAAMIYLVSMVWSQLEHATCAAWIDPIEEARMLGAWNVEVSPYACGRMLGSLEPYAQPIVCTIFAVWVWWADRRARVS